MKTNAALYMTLYMKLNMKLNAKQLMIIDAKLVDLKMNAKLNMQRNAKLNFPRNAIPILKTRFKGKFAAWSANRFPTRCARINQLPRLTINRSAEPNIPSHAIPFLKTKFVIIHSRCVEAHMNTEPHLPLCADRFQGQFHARSANRFPTRCAIWFPRRSADQFVKTKQ